MSFSYFFPQDWCSWLPCWVTNTDWPECMLPFTLTFSCFTSLFSTFQTSLFQLCSLAAPLSVHLTTLFDCVLQVSQTMWLDIYHMHSLLSFPHGKSGLSLVGVLNLQMLICVAISLCEASIPGMLTAVLKLCKEVHELCSGYQVLRRSQIPWAKVKGSSWTILFPPLTHTQLYFWCTYKLLYSHFWSNLRFNWVELQVGRSLSLCWQAKPSPIFTLTCSLHESPWSLAFLRVEWV